MIKIKKTPVANDVIMIFMIASIIPYGVGLIDYRYSFFIPAGEYKLTLTISTLPA